MVWWTYLVGEDFLRLLAYPPLPHLVENLEEERVLLPEHLDKTRNSHSADTTQR